MLHCSLMTGEVHTHMQQALGAHPSIASSASILTMSMLCMFAPSPAHTLMPLLCNKIWTSVRRTLSQMMDAT
jgi:hypothetical protein